MMYEAQALALQNLHIIGRDAFEDVIGYIGFVA